MKNKPYLLVVDDERINRMLLEDLIEDRYELGMASSGEACLASVKQRVPELILLDVSMPGIDGFETCRRLKSSPDTRTIPIIFLTARITIEDERKGLQLGAVDYITKPFSESILLARINTHLTLNKTQQLLEKSYAAIQKDQAYIEYIMLSMRKDKRFVADNIATLISPVEKSNGDIVLSAFTPNGHRHFLIGDFTGHGLSAAIAGPLVSSLFYTQSEQGVALKQVIKTLNSELLAKLPVEIFMAAIFIDWELKSNRLTVWNCGMPPLLYFNQEKGMIELPSQYLALGITETLIDDKEGSVLTVQSGEVLFAYSDGVQEVHSSTGDVFGEQRLKTLLRKVVDKQAALSFVMDTLSSYANGQELKDDITLVELSIP